MILYSQCIFVHGLHSSVKHLVIDDIFLFYYQAQEQITQMVFRPVNMPHIIDHGKNMDFVDSDHKLSRIGLVIC